jgi:hypothetical protein
VGGGYSTLAFVTCKVFELFYAQAETEHRPNKRRKSGA